MIAAYIDHTLLKADCKTSEIRALCAEAKQYHFASVCVNPCWVALVARELKGTPVKVCTVIGFPLGANSTNTKVFEAEEALRNGAQEVDMVLNISKLKEGDFGYVQKEIEALACVVKGKALLKVILETAVLTNEEKYMAATIAKEAGADFVKTSTGFSTGGATYQDVALLRKIVGPHMGVKASGGISTFEEAQRMVQAGANRIGASKGVTIAQEELVLHEGKHRSNHKNLV